MKNQILVIGTIPPCPRCKLLKEILLIEVKNSGIDGELRHIAYTSEEASLIAKGLGLEAGTANEVAKKMGQTMSSNPLESSEIEALNWDEEVYKNFEHLKSLFKEVNILDNRLRIYEDAAEENGILMAPVFIINGKVIHKGSVPNIEIIKKALSEL